MSNLFSCSATFCWGAKYLAAPLFLANFTWNTERGISRPVSMGIKWKGSRGRCIHARGYRAFPRKPFKKMSVFRHSSPIWEENQPAIGHRNFWETTEFDGHHIWSLPCLILFFQEFSEFIAEDVNRWVWVNCLQKRRGSGKNMNDLGRSSVRGIMRKVFSARKF